MEQFNDAELRLMRRGLEVWKSEFETISNQHRWGEVDALVEKLDRLLNEMKE